MFVRFYYMNHAIETEIKVLLSREQFNRLASFYQPLTFVRQINTYYKNNNSDHYAFRIREKEGTLLFTLKNKTPEGVMEYEKIIEGEPEDDPDVVRTVSFFGIEPPYEKLGKLVTYRAMVISELAELCFDINIYNGRLDYEIEYEVKKEHDHLKAFKHILEKAGIEYVPNKDSKYKRFVKSAGDNDNAK